MNQFFVRLIFLITILIWSCKPKEHGHVMVDFSNEMIQASLHKEGVSAEAMAYRFLEQENWHSVGELLQKNVISEPYQSFVRSRWYNARQMSDSALFFAAKALDQDAFRLQYMEWYLQLLLSQSALQEAKKVGQRLALVQSQHPALALLDILQLVENEQFDSALLLLKIHDVPSSNSPFQRYKLNMALQIAEERQDIEMQLHLLGQLQAIEYRSEHDFLIARLMFKKRENEKALKQLESYLDKANTVESYLKSIDLLVANGLSSNARFYLENMLARNEADLVAKLYAARFYETTNELSLAKQQIEDVLKIDETNEIALQQLETVNRKIAYLRLQQERARERRELEQIKVLNPINL
jgi:hypothetical protein